MNFGALDGAAGAHSGGTDLGRQAVEQRRQVIEQPLVRNIAGRRNVADGRFAVREDLVAVLSDEAAQAHVTFAKRSLHGHAVNMCTRIVSQASASRRRFLYWARERPS